MDLSIIVATYGRPKNLEELIKSLRNANPPDFKWELIIAYNGVKEDNREFILEELNRLDFPMILLMDPVQGKSRALNSGIEKAAGTFLAFLDDDAEVHKNYLTEIERAIKTYTVNIFGGRVLPVWPQKAITHWMTGGKKLHSSRGPIVVHDYGNEVRKYDHNMVLPIGCNFICKKEIFLNYNIWFDTNLGPGSGKGHMGGEETKVLKAFLSHNEKILYVPQIAVEHPVDEERLTKRYFRYRMFCSGRSRPYVLKGPFPSTLGVPRYIFKLTAKEAVLFFSSLLRFNYLSAFEHELNVFNHCGAMYQYLLVKYRKS